MREIAKDHKFYKLNVQFFYIFCWKRFLFLNVIKFHSRKRKKPIAAGLAKKSLQNKMLKDVYGAKEPQRNDYYDIQNDAIGPSDLPPYFPH